MSDNKCLYIFTTK